MEVDIAEQQAFAPSGHENAQQLHVAELVHQLHSLARSTVSMTTKLHASPKPLPDIGALQRYADDASQLARRLSNQASKTHEQAQVYYQTFLQAQDMLKRISNTKAEV